MVARGSRTGTEPWWRSRVTFVLAMLVALIGMVTVLAWEAFCQSRSHRDTAARVVDDYASLMAVEFSRRVASVFERQVSYRAGPLLRGSGVASMADLSRLGGGEEGLASRLVQSFLRYDIDSDQLALSADRMGDRSADRITADVLQWFTDEDWRGTLVGVPALYFLPAKNGEVARAYGLILNPPRAGAHAKAIIGMEYDPQVICEILAAVFESGDLLPGPLAERNQHAEAVGLRVSVKGEEIFSAGRFGYAAGTGTEEFASSSTGVLIETSLGQELAGDLLIGGLPRSRLPLLAATLILSLIFAAVSVWLLLREQELTRLRTGFIESVSHELRTPLAQIRLYAETLLLGRVRSEQEERESLRVIDVEARRLDHLVANVLDFSGSTARLAQGVTQHPAEVVAAVIAGFRPLAEAGKAQIEDQIELIGSVAMEASSLRQVLLNLLDNAVKYGPPGQTLRVELSRTSDYGRLVVDDEGPGVAPEDRSRVWQRYWRASAHQQRTTGAGIGLSMVQDLVQSVGGRVRVSQAPSGGARFSLDIPLAPCDES